MSSSIHAAEEPPHVSLWEQPAQWECIRENAVGWKDGSQLNSAQNLRAAVAAAMLRHLQDGLEPSLCGAAGSPAFASEKQHAINLF